MLPESVYSSDGVLVPDFDRVSGSSDEPSDDVERISDDDDSVCYSDHESTSVVGDEVKVFHEIACLFHSTHASADGTVW